jgi:hypothetical protein
MNKKIKIIFPVIIALSLLVGACGSSDTTGKLKDKYRKAPVRLGTYEFMIYDTTSFRLADGNLIVESAVNNRLAGSYEIMNQYVDEIPGIFEKKGQFEGQYSLEEKKISINMNPKIADANVFLFGDTYKDSIIGTWNFSTMRGVTNKGMFKAYYKADNK